jgi:hypothetical protein
VVRSAAGDVAALVPGVRGFIGYARAGRPMHLRRVGGVSPDSGLVVRGASGSAGAMAAIDGGHGTVRLVTVRADGTPAPRARRIRLLRTPHAMGQDDIALALDGHGRGVVAAFAEGGGRSGAAYEVAATFDAHQVRRRVLHRLADGLAQSGVTASLTGDGRGRVAFGEMWHGGLLRAFRFTLPPR